jgi:hypothetical protein
MCKVNLFLGLTNEALRHEYVWGSGCVDPHVFFTSALVASNGQGGISYGVKLLNFAFILYRG